MFSVKISYHHQGRLAIRYRGTLHRGFTGRFPRSKPTPACPQLPAWRRALSLQSDTLPGVFFQLNLLVRVCQARFWEGKCTDQFFPAVQTWNGMRFSSVRRPPPLLLIFLSMPPAAQHHLKVVRGVSLLFRGGQGACSPPHSVPGKRWLCKAELLRARGGFTPLGEGGTAGHFTARFPILDLSGAF